MNLLSYNDLEMIFFLEKTTILWKAANEIYHKTQTNTDEGISLIDYYKFQDLFYMKMIGITAKEAHATSAWYRYEKNNYRTEAIKGPEGYSGYIPDCINNIIYNGSMTAVDKHELLKVMMLDLVKIRELNRIKKELFPST